MSNRVFASVLLIALGLSLVPAWAADNSSAPTKKDLKALCDKVNNVCHAACERGGNFSNQLSEILCRSDCDTKMMQCHASIPRRQRLEETTGVQTDGMQLYQKNETAPN